MQDLHIGDHSCIFIVPSNLNTIKSENIDKTCLKLTSEIIDDDWGYDEHLQTVRDFKIAQALYDKYPEYVPKVWGLFEQNLSDFKSIISTKSYDQLRHDGECTKVVGFYSEYIEGINIQKWIKTVKYDDFIKVMQKLFKFLYDLRDNFTHYDLHFGNIFITKNNSFKILDFGSSFLCLKTSYGILNLGRNEPDFGITNKCFWAQDIYKIIHNLYVIVDRKKYLGHKLINNLNDNYYIYLDDKGKYVIKKQGQIKCAQAEEDEQIILYLEDVYNILNNTYDNEESSIIKHKYNKIARYELTFNHLDLIQWVDKALSIFDSNIRSEFAPKFIGNLALIDKWLNLNFTDFMKFIGFLP